MIHYSSTSTIFLGCALLALSGFASADVVQCTDSGGKITYTDVACRHGDNTASVATVSHPVAAKIKALSPKAFALAQKARESTWAKKPAGARNLPLDVATAKMARSSILEIDAERIFLRRQKLVALN
jgi:hypothetical protein